MQWLKRLGPSGNSTTDEGPALGRPSFFFFFTGLTSNSSARGVKTFNDLQWPGTGDATYASTPGLPIQLQLIVQNRKLVQSVDLTYPLRKTCAILNTMISFHFFFISTIKVIGRTSYSILRWKKYFDGVGPTPHVGIYKVFWSFLFIYLKK